MKGLTLWRPWAWAVLHAGKRVENRSWPAPRSVVGIPIALHAGKTWDPDAVEFIEDVCGGLACPPKASHPSGVIVGVMTIVRVVYEPRMIRDDNPDEAVRSGWFCGPYGWVLDDVYALPDPVPCRGAQGLFEVPNDVDRSIWAQQ